MELIEWIPIHDKFQLTVINYAASVFNAALTLNPVDDLKFEGGMRLAKLRDEIRRQSQTLNGTIDMLNREKPPPPAPTPRP